MSRAAGAVGARLYYQLLSKTYRDFPSTLNMAHYPESSESKRGPGRAIYIMGTL